jgi:hypothetical protein
MTRRRAAVSGNRGAGAGVQREGGKETTMRRLMRRLTRAFIPRCGFPPRPVLVALILTLCPLAAGEPPTSERPPEQPPFYQLTTEGRAALCGASAVLAGAEGPPAVVAYLRAGVQLDVWFFFDPTYVHPIEPKKLAEIEDGKAVADDVGSGEQDAYFDMLIFANRTLPEAFDAAAKENAAVGFAQLYQEPALHHGQVVHVEGRLKRLRRFGPQPNARAGGVLDYYEGVLAVASDHRVWVVFTELPPGLEVKEDKEEMDVPAGFSGYFFKKVRYEAKRPPNTPDDGRPRKTLYIPTLIGRTPTLLPEPPPASDPAASPAPAAAGEWVGYIMTLFLIILGGVGASVFLLGFWFRRSDARVRARVNAVRYGELVLPPPVAVPVAPPPAYGVSPDAPAGERNRLLDGPGRRPEPGSPDPRPE